MDRKTEIKAIEGLLSYLNKSYRVPQLQGKSPWAKKAEAKEPVGDAPVVDAPVGDAPIEPKEESKQLITAMSRASKNNKKGKRNK